jgi:hypothetical protein
LLQEAVLADEILDKRVPGVRQQVSGRIILHQFPVVEHGDLVTHLQRLVDVVGDEDDRHVQPLLNLKEFVLELFACNGVKRAERFVHKHNVWLRCQRACDTDALLLAAGEALRIAFFRVGRELNQVK